jgi:hypothetical protein
LSEAVAVAVLEDQGPLLLRQAVEVAQEDLEQVPDFRLLRGLHILLLLGAEVQQILVAKIHLSIQLLLQVGEMAVLI